MKRLILFQVFFLLLNYSCTSEHDNVDAKENNNYSSEKIKIKSTKKDLTPSEVYNLLNDKTYQLIDVREEYEYKESHIKGVKLIPLGTLQNSLNYLDKNGKYIMICRSGRRSIKGAEILRNNGFKNVYNMVGGMLEWEANNLPVEK